MTDAGDRTVAEMRKIARKNGENTYQELLQVWSAYDAQIGAVSKRCRYSGYTRCKALKNGYTHPKNARDRNRKR